MTDEMSERLSRIPLFSTLEPSHLAAVAELVSPFEVGAGHVLVQPGLVGSGLFLIEEGTVTLSVQDKDVELGSGEFFGELALLDDRAVRTARVKASTPVRGTCIQRDDFTKLLSSEPKVAIAMLKVLAHRLVDMIGH